jgi:glycosyltransferase involved in cell wall biosynthesis
MPEVSVIMPVYNAGQYLSEAMESILKQRFKDFEFIIIDDASQDNSPELIKKYEDSRIVFVENQENIGVARTLNRGLELARGRYIARMDADDISMPERLDRQVRFMDEHPEIGISGGWVQLFGIGPSTIARKPTDPREVSTYMLFENPLWHMTVIMRRELLLHHKLYYDPIFSRSEDFDLWAKAIQHFPMANLGEVLVRVREHRGSATRANWDEVTRQTESILGRLLENSGFSVTSEEISFHHRVGRGYRMNSKQEIERAEAWLQKLCDMNSVKKRFADDSLRTTVATVWFRVCANSGPLGPWIYQKWVTSPLQAGLKQPLMSVARFVASIIWHRFRRIFA